MVSRGNLCFLLPGPIDHAVGGYRIAFLYSEFFAKNGWAVRILIPHLKYRPKTRKEFLKAVYWALRSKFKKPLQWFEFHRIQPNYIPFFTGLLPREILVAVGADSMEASISAACEHRTIHFVQGYENWSHEEVYLSELFARAARRVVISKGLLTRMEALGLEATIIPNPVERNNFHIEIPYADRKNFSIGFMVHEQPLKAWRVAWNAALLLQAKYPEVQIHCFGTDVRPAELPETVSYLRSPDRKELRTFFNSLRVFLAPSLSEGWGLTPSEAMQCGCCVVASDIDGHREFMVHETNGLLASPGEPEAFYIAAEAILMDPKLGERLAAQAVQSMKQYSMETSIAAWEPILKELADSSAHI